MASDVKEIYQLGNGGVNEFASSITRKLPEPIKIKFDSSLSDADSMYLYTFNGRLKNGYRILPGEIDKANAITYRRFEHKMDAEDKLHFTDSVTGEIKNELKYGFLKSKLLNGELSETETLELKKCLSIETSSKVKILTDELKKSDEEWKKVGIDYKNEIQAIIALSIHFEPERLSEGKHAVWWDYERFIHIYIRHVTETHIGKRNTNRTTFQYQLSDIKRVVKEVIRRIEDEIIKHFEENPDKDFNRNGTMSVYFNGDYYSIRITPDGRLMRFHKND